MCKKHSEIGGEIFVAENSGIRPKTLILIHFSAKSFQLVGQNIQNHSMKSISISFDVARIFFGKPPQKDSEYPTRKYVFYVAEFSTKNFRNKLLVENIELWESVILVKFLQFPQLHWLWPNWEMPEREHFHCE